MLAERVQGLNGFGIGLCTCGHLQSHHSNLRSPLKTKDGKAHLEHHHGGCCKGECECKRFTFARWASLEEVAAMYIEQPACV